MHRPSERADRAERKCEKEFPQSQTADSGEKRYLRVSLQTCQNLVIGCVSTTCAWLRDNRWLRKYVCHFVSLTGFRADGYGAGQRVGQASYD